MKNLVLALFVAISGISFSQPNRDSLNKLPFNVVTNPTTFYDLSSFDLNVIYNLEVFSQSLSERYGCYVWCDDFIDMYGFKDIIVFLSPLGSEGDERTIITSLSTAENLYKRGILLENVILYYEIYDRTSEN
jgi:hypothetical protein